MASDDHLLRFGGSSPVIDPDPPAAFEILVVVEEVMDLLQT